MLPDRKLIVYRFTRTKIVFLNTVKEHLAGLKTFTKTRLNSLHSSNSKTNIVEIKPICHLTLYSLKSNLKQHVHKAFLYVTTLQRKSSEIGLLSSERRPPPYCKNMPFTFAILLVTAPINNRDHVVVRPPTPLDWAEIAVGLAESPKYPGHLPDQIFFCGTAL